MSDREQFFHWAMDNGYMLETLQDNRNTFEFEDTRNAWCGWQASSQVAQDKITALEKAVKNVNEDCQRLEANADRTEAFLNETITALEARNRELEFCVEKSFYAMQDFNPVVDKYGFSITEAINLCKKALFNKFTQPTEALDRFENEK